MKERWILSCDWFFLHGSEGQFQSTVPQAGNWLQARWPRHNWWHEKRKKLRYYTPKTVGVGVNLWFNPILSVSALGSPLTLISSYFYSDVCSMKYFCEMDVQIEYSIRRKALCCLFKKSNDIKKSSDIITPLFFNKYFFNK